MVSEILGFLLNKGGRAWPRRVPAGVTGCVLAQGTRIYIWLRGGEGFLRY